MLGIVPKCLFYEADVWVVPDKICTCGPKLYKRYNHKGQLTGINKRIRARPLARNARCPYESFTTLNIRGFREMGRYMCASVDETKMVREALLHVSGVIKFFDKGRESD